MIEFMNMFKLISPFKLKGYGLIMFILLLFQACQSNPVEIEYDNSAPIQDTLLDIPERLSFKNYTVENGLPENSAFSIKKDYHGNLWVTTQNGIAKFSNNKFVAYTHSSVDSHTIYPEYNWINILPDSTLVAYSSLGVSAFNAKSNSFNRILTVPKEDKLYDLHDENNQVDYDHFGYWYQSRKDSLLKRITLKGETETFKIKGVIKKKLSFKDFTVVQTMDADSLDYIYRIDLNDNPSRINLLNHSSNSLGDVVKVNNSEFYYIVDDLIYHSKKGYLTKVKTQAKNHFNKLLIQPETHELIIFTSYANEIQTHSYENGQLSTYNELVSGVLIDFCSFNQDNVLCLIHEINKEDKVRLYIINDLTINKVKTDLNDQFKIFYDAYRKIFTDQKGNIFLGTWSKGLFHANTQTQSSFKYQLTTNKETLVPFYVNGNELYYYTYRGEFYRLNLKNDDVTKIYSVSDVNYLISWKQINDKIYITASNEGMIIFDIQTKSIYESEVNKLLSDGDIFVTNSFLDSKGRTWLTSSVDWYSKHSIMQVQNGQLKTFNSVDTLKTFKDPRVMDIFEYEGKIYITVQVYGLYVFDEDTEEFIGMEEEDVIQMSRLVNIKNNEVWSSSFTNGLVKMKLPEHEVSEIYSRENNKLPISWINHFCFVSDSIMILNGETEQWYKLNVKTAEYSLISDYQEKYFLYNFYAVSYQNQYSILPAIDGVVFYDFNSVTKPSATNIALTHLSVNDKVIVNPNVLNVSRLDLAYDQNNLTLNLNNSKPFNPNNEHYYRVLGYTSDWIKFNVENEININSLQPGSYQLEIKIVGVNGESSAIKNILTIKVLKPWWQSIWFYMFSILILLCLGYLIFKLKNRQLIKKQLELEHKIEEATSEIRAKKEEVELQKEIIEEVHKEITDSINYAERIQRSFLATDQLLSTYLKEYFVYFNPKDVVSGDFYWAKGIDKNKLLMLNADSTGHGVPGAIMSILNITSVEKAIENGATTPANIFNVARQIIIDRLKNDGSEEGGKDGMDASLICIDFNNLQMTYCAANNPIWIIRGGELIEIKPEKMPVGKHHFDDTPFVGGEFQLEKNDIIYTLTDGFQDQFGGEKGKKFKVKPFKQLLIENAQLTLDEQKQKVEERFSNWKGNLEQVDDVCLIGVKV